MGSLDFRGETQLPQRSFERRASKMKCVSYVYAWRL